MAWNFRRSKKIFPGVRINLSKTGIGFSAGARGARVSRSAKGRITGSVGIPGTGLSYRETLNSKKNMVKGNDSKSERNKRFSTGRIFGWAFSLVFLYSGVVNFKSDSTAGLASFLIGIGLIGFLIRSKNKTNSISSDESDENLFPNSKYTNEPKTIKEWKEVLNEFEELSRLLQCVKNKVGDKKNAPNFPSDKGEVVFYKSNITLTNYEESEYFDSGIAYLTNDRIVFLGSNQTEQWSVDSIASPLPFDDKRILVIQSLEHSTVYAFKFDKRDDYLTFSFNALGVFSARDNLDKFIEATKQSIIYYEKLKPAR